MSMGSKDPNNAPDDTTLSRMGGPWMPTQGPLKELLTRLGAAYGPDDVPTYGPTTTRPLNANQTAGLQGILGAARGGIPGMTAGMNNLAQYTTSDPNSMPGADFYSNLAQGGASNPAYSNFLALNNQAGQGGAAQTGIDTLSQFATGANLGTNPYLKSLLDTGTQSIRDNYTNTVAPGLEGMVSMSGAGGGGSMEALMKGQSEQALGKTLGDYTTNFLGNAYNTDRSQQLTAAGALPGAEGTQIGTGLAAASGLQGASQTNLANQQAGVAGQTSNYQQALNNSLGVTTALPGIFSGSMTPFNLMTGVGDVQANNLQQRLQEQQQIHQFNQSAVPNQLNDYLKSLLGVASAGNPAAGAAYASSQNALPSGGQAMIGNILGLLGGGAQAYGAYQGGQNNAALLAALGA